MLKQRLKREKIQVQLDGSSAAGSREQVALPDGRVVSFVVPEGFSPGQVIEVEVGRTTYDGSNQPGAAPLPKAVTREDLATFFRKGVEAMEDETTMALLLDPKATLRPGKRLIELQQVEFDKLGIDRQVGCVAVVGKDTGGIFAALRAWLGATWAAEDAPSSPAFCDLKPPLAQPKVEGRL